jgi:hypothetical protein
MLLKVDVGSLKEEETQENVVEVGRVGVERCTRR